MAMDQRSQERFDQLARSLTNITPTHEEIERIEGIREMAQHLGFNICTSAPDSRERSLALTHLEDCVMWAVKSIVLE